MIQDQKWYFDRIMELAGEIKDIALLRRIYKLTEYLYIHVYNYKDESEVHDERRA